MKQFTFNKTSKCINRGIWTVVILCTLASTLACESQEVDDDWRDTPEKEFAVRTLDDGQVEKRLTVPKYTQQPYEWLCWATSVAMVVSYFNDDEINRTIAIAQDYFNSTTDFNKPLSLEENDGIIVEQYTDDVSSLFHGATRSHPFFDDYKGQQLSYENIKLYIDHSFPIIAVLASSVSPTGGSHAVVVVGYSEVDGVRSVIYNDPWYKYDNPWDEQEFIMSYDSFKNTMCYTLFYTGPTAPKLPEPPNDSFETAKKINPSGTPEPIVDNFEESEEKYFKFTAPAYALYTIETSGNTDTVGELYTGNLELVTMDDDSNADGNFKMVYASTGMKNYYIRVTRKDQGGTGEFSISVTISSLW